MSQSPYNYTNRAGLLPISWEDFHGICKALAVAIEGFRPDIILPVGRGGYYPGTLLSHLLQTEIYPVRVSRRVNDVVTHASPQWILEPPASIAGLRVVIVDEICDTGETIQIVKTKAAALGAAEVRSAVLYSHSWGAQIPDWIGFISDTLILNPWDREILRDGIFEFHRELAGAIARQELEFNSSMLIEATKIVLAKG